VSKNFTTFSAFLDSLDFQPNPGGKIVKKIDRQKRIADCGLRKKELRIADCGLRIAEGFCPRNTRKTRKVPKVLHVPKVPKVLQVPKVPKVGGILRFSSL
jgi:hypothetical protein